LRQEKITMSDTVLPAKSKRTPSRLPASEDGITQRMRRMMHAMIYEGATLEEGAAAAGFRLRRARALLTDPIFMGEFRKLPARTVDR
jgi:hypothetical protein